MQPSPTGSSSCFESAKASKSNCSSLRNNLTTNADRLTDRVGKLVRRGVNDLAMNLVRITSIILQSTGNFTQVLVESDRIRLAWASFSMARLFQDGREMLPLSQVSIVASTSLFFSIRATSLNISSARSTLGRSRHAGFLNALRAALTAMSTSSGSAAYTDAISLSSLQGAVRNKRGISGKDATYVGFMLVIFSPCVDLTHSLLMNKPVGWVNLTPLGAVSSTVRSDMAVLKGLRGPNRNGRRMNWLGRRCGGGEKRRAKSLSMGKEKVGRLRREGSIMYYFAGSSPLWCTPPLPTLEMAWPGTRLAGMWESVLAPPVNPIR